MRNIYGKAGVSSVNADIETADHGGFIAVASTGDVDRDNEVIAPGAFNPLPASVPVHLDHVMTARGVIGRGRPYYVGTDLMLDATFDGGTDAQDIRRKVSDGILDSLSIVFRGLKWKDIDGVRTCVKGELLAADIVSIPSNSGARILSMRSLQLASRELADEAMADALLVLARAEIAESKRLLGNDGRHRRRINDLLYDVLAKPTPARPLRSM